MTSIRSCSKRATVSIQMVIDKMRTHRGHIVCRAQREHVRVSGGEEDSMDSVISV